MLFCLRRLVIQRYLTRTASSKPKKPGASSKNAAAIRKLNWENKTLYGELVETSAERKSRLTQNVNKQTVLEQPVAYDVNSKATPKPVKSKDTSSKVGTSAKSETDFVGKFPLYPEENTKSIDLNAFQSVLQKKNLANVFPSVTKILQATLSPQSLKALEVWKQKLIAELGEDGFYKYQQEMFDTGKQLHSLTQECLQSGQLPSESDIHPNVLGYWKSISSVMPDFRDPVMLETKVTHPYLQYLGVADGIAYYKDSIVLIEWKTAQKEKATLQNTFDAPLQVAAYVGAVAASTPALAASVQRAVIVVCYQSGTSAHVHNLYKTQLQAYWREWTKRLTQYWNAQLLP